MRKEVEKKKDERASFFSLLQFLLSLPAPLFFVSSPPFVHQRVVALLSRPRAEERGWLENRARKKRERRKSTEKDKKGRRRNEMGRVESRARKHCSAAWFNKQPRRCSRTRRALLDGVEKRARRSEREEERRARNHRRRRRSRERRERVFSIVVNRRRRGKRASSLSSFAAAAVAAASSSSKGVYVPPRSPARSERRSCP